MDLDNDACAPHLRSDLLPQQAARMCFRVAIREIEAWLLADRERISRFLSVARTRISTTPDDLDDPKRALVEAARRSRSRAMREDIVPADRSGRTVGRAYSARMTEFVMSEWRPEVAAGSSSSLARCLSRLTELVEAERRGM
jgi:hypothetical protein